MHQQMLTPAHGPLALSLASSLPACTHAPDHAQLARLHTSRMSHLLIWYINVTGGKSDLINPLLARLKTTAAIESLFSCPADERACYEPRTLTKEGLCIPAEVYEQSPGISCRAAKDAGGRCQSNILHKPLSSAHWARQQYRSSAGAYGR